MLRLGNKTEIICLLIVLMHLDFTSKQSDTHCHVCIIEWKSMEKQAD